MSEPVKIIIIEDNPQYTQSLRTMISISNKLEFVASYSSGEAYFESLSEHSDQIADIVLLDLQLPGKSGLQLIPIIREKMPDSNILVLTQNNDYHTTIEAISLGVSGYLLKDSPSASIREAIIELHQGTCIIDPQLSRIVLQALSSSSELDDESPLTAREQRVLELLSMGYVKKEVAERMEVSYRTISQYTENIYKKLQVPNVAAAVATAIRKGMI